MPVNKKRLAMDIQIAENELGPNRVLWAPDLSWVYIKEFSLPDNFMDFRTNILILVPATYGYGGRFRDIFINRDLEVLSKDGRTYEKLGKHLHYFDKYPYASMTEEMKEKFVINKWGYLCVHDGSADSGVLNYLYKVKLYLANIHKDWKAIYEKYTKKG